MFADVLTFALYRLRWWAKTTQRSNVQPAWRSLITRAISPTTLEFTPARSLLLVIAVKSDLLRKATSWGTDVLTPARSRSSANIATSHIPHPVISVCILSACIRARSHTNVMFVANHSPHPAISLCMFALTAVSGRISVRSVRRRLHRAALSLHTKWYTVALVLTAARCVTKATSIAATCLIICLVYIWGSVSNAVCAKKLSRANNLANVMRRHSILPINSPL